MSRDRDYNKLINTMRWRRLRHSKLSDQPLCERCLKEGRVTAASEVHHKVPVESSPTMSGKTSLMYDYANLMSICHECHVKEHKEMGRAVSKEQNRQKNAKSLDDFRKKFLS